MTLYQICSGSFFEDLSLAHVINKQTDLCRLLASKNLPAAIEDTGGNELPESLREKAEGVQSQGGLSSLEEKYYGLPELLTRNKEILSEVRCIYKGKCGS